MRVGQNPAKFVDTVSQPADVTIAVVNFIPFLSGFYEHSLEVLKACLNSIRMNTGVAFDLMVFDNHSCREVRHYLQTSFEEGMIQYLVLSDKNIGKIGAWNYMFGAAQGMYVAFSDSDIYFRPGWLSASRALIDSFPQAGMVTARPLRTPDIYSETTIGWGRKQGDSIYQEGSFLDWDVYIEHTDSIGMSREEARKQYEQSMDHLIKYQGYHAYSGAAHFQFLTRKEILNKIMPLKSEKPMRGERSFDIAIDSLGYLRLCTEKPFVLHMGNRPPLDVAPVPPSRKNHFRFTKIAKVQGIKRILLWLYNQIFQIYFNDVD